MIRYRYNTKLNTKPKIFIYTPWEIFIGAMISISPVVVTLVAGLDPKPLDALIIFVLFTLFLLAFKIGKPEGYLAHFIEHYTSPDEFRPGGKVVEYPVAPDNALDIEESINDRENLHNSAVRLQKKLVSAGIIPLNRHGSYLILDTDKKDSEKLINDCNKVLNKNKLLIIDE